MDNLPIKNEHKNRKLIIRLIFVVINIIITVILLPMLMGVLFLGWIFSGLVVGNPLEMTGIFVAPIIIPLILSIFIKKLYWLFTTFILILVALYFISSETLGYFLFWYVGIFE